MSERKYELPESQRKMNGEQGDGEVEMQSLQRAEELSKQYEEIKDRTVDDGTVLGMLKDIDTAESNARIIIHVDLPGEASNKQFRFRKPKVWSESYKFVRWIKHYDYDADSFPGMLEDQCKVKVIKDGTESYALFIPEQKTLSKRISGYRERAGNAIRVVSHAYLRDDMLISAVFIGGLAIHAIAEGTGLIVHDMTPTQSFGVHLIILSILVIVALSEQSFKSYLRRKWMI